MTVTEVLTPGPAVGLAGLLDEPAGAIGDGWPLPPLWHWVYLLDRPATAALGPDGHPAHGIPAPPTPGRRRMYAGGRVTTHRALVLGRPATSALAVTGTVERNGRSGPFTVVTTTRTVTQDGALAVTDEVDIVYRPPTALPPSAAGPAPGAGETWAYHLDEALLFRFSALTYNAHRIHYDASYCRREDYPGLVVHGPLQALLMARHGYGPEPATPSTFSYRLVAPLILGQGLVVGRDADNQVTVRDSAGRLTATGRLST